MGKPDADIWQGPIDHKRWHALVHAGTRQVVRLFGPHVKGTLRVSFKRNEEVLIALADAPNKDMIALCRRGAAAVGPDARVHESQTEETRRKALQAELEGIDRETARKIAEGVEYNGKRHSLSTNAIAKLDALFTPSPNSFPLEYPIEVSALDNMSTLVLASRAEVAALRDAAQVRLRDLIAEGDRLKAAARSRAAGG